MWARSVPTTDPLQEALLRMTRHSDANVAWAPIPLRPRRWWSHMHVCTFHDIISQRCHYTTPFHPVQTRDQINTIHTPSQSTHTHVEIQGLVSVIEIKRSVSRGHDLVVSGDALLTPLEPGELRSRPRSLSLTFPPTIIHLFTSFHIRLVIDAYLASNENISVCVWVDCCRTCHEP